MSLEYKEIYTAQVAVWEQDHFVFVDKELYALIKMFDRKVGSNNPYKRYSDEWFKHEYPEYVNKYTAAEWEKLFKEHNPGATKGVLKGAIDNCIRIYGTPEGVDNEFGPVCP